MRTLVCAFVLLFVVPLGMSAASGDLLADETSQLLQNTRADAEHLSRMTSVAVLRRFVRSGYLVPVPAGSRTFYLHEISPQYRYCRPWTRLFIERMGRQYYARFGQPLRVTSLVRTVGRQMLLARFNENAADATGSGRSSHLTGATVDVSKRWMSEEQQEWMRDKLSSLRDAGYLYAIEEFEQPTFHIMVYRNYQSYGKRSAAVKRAAANGHARKARVLKARTVKTSSVKPPVIKATAETPAATARAIKPRAAKTVLSSAGLVIPTIEKNGQ